MKIYDHVIIGSGFGGSVSALRLTEKGYDVAVLEKGRRFKDKDYPKNNRNPRTYLWVPKLRFFGPQMMKFFRESFVLGGVGVGGGSLIYANTHMIPQDEFFQNPVWSGLNDWKSVLAP
ncbi:MAG: NAD(P)-binding protein, partial [Flavobacteriales bacterium]|nr:NAD(P)-binding protein [Flavobacteriales bacterium]